jgi:hypothetical protein
MPPGRLSFDAKMFPSMEKARRLRRVRIAMLAAACLAVSAGFGLHPEPGSSRAAPRLAVHGATAVDSAPGTHDCLACRAHRPLLAAATPALVSNAAGSTALLVAPSPLAIRVFPLLHRDGRSPPTAS